MIVVGLGLLLLLVEAFRDEKQGNDHVVLGITIVGLLAALWSLTVNPWQPEYAPQQTHYLLAGTIAIDGLGSFFRAVLLLTALLVALASLEYVKKRDIEVGSFYSLMLFATAGAMFMVIAGDMLTFYMGLELLSITSYILVGTFRRSYESSEASLKYLLNGAVASSVLLFGLSLIYGLTGSTSMEQIAARLFEIGATPLSLTAVLLVLSGLAFKISAVPFHFWTPDVYHGAPTPITAFLSVASKGASFAAILRIFYIAFGAIQAEWSLAFTVLSILSMTIGNIAALRQRNVKRMLAYSSVAHAGYILAGLAVASATGFSSVMFYILTYAFMNMAAFAAVIAVANQRDSEELDAFKGLIHQAPWLAIVFLLALLSLIGIPPFAGFWAKLYLFRATVQAGLFWLAVAIALNSAISIGYYYNVVKTMFVSEAPTAGQPKFAVGSALQIGLALAAIGVLALGLAPDAFLRWATLAALVH